MTHRTRRRGLLAAAALTFACQKDHPARPAPPARVDAGSPAAAPGPLPAPPSNALMVFRGAGLRKLVTLVAPGVPTRVALGQAVPGLTPGIGEHGVDLDPDAPFAAILAPRDPDGAPGQLGLTVAWPLRPGMEIAQNAQAGRGYREVSAGIWEPTTTEGDAGAGGPCWVARKPPAGWAMVCGPRETLREMAGWLVRAAASAPEGDSALDVNVQPAPARRTLERQLALLEAQDPRRNDAGTNRELVAQYDAVHRSAQNTRQLIDDLSRLHGSLSIGEDDYRLTAEAEFTNATGASTRALVASARADQRPFELLRRLPAAASSYFVTAFDTAALAPLIAADEDDPRVAQLLGPEMVRFQRGLRELTGFRRSGYRAMGFFSEDGGSRMEVVRVGDARGAIAELRRLANAVPRTPRPSGANPGDYFAILPTPGMPEGSIRLRLGPDPARLPPNVPADVRRNYQRSVLLVPDGEVLVLIDALDPVARYTAARSGDRLAISESDAGVSRTAALVHLSPAAVVALLGAPPSDALSNTDPLHATLTSERVGDNGARFHLDARAPIASVNQVRDFVAALQAQQARMMEQARQAQEQAQQAARRAAQQRAGSANGAPSGIRLPDPPNFQLQRPGQ